MARDDFYASPFGAIFSAYMERPRLSRATQRSGPMLFFDATAGERAQGG